MVFFDLQERGVKDEFARGLKGDHFFRLGIAGGAISRDGKNDGKVFRRELLVGFLLEILRAFPITVRLLANMAKTAISGFSRPAMARGIPMEL